MRVDTKRVKREGLFYLVAGSAAAATIVGLYELANMRISLGLLAILYAAFVLAGLGLTIFLAGLLWDGNWPGVLAGIAFSPALLLTGYLGLRMFSLIFPALLPPIPPPPLFP